MSKLTLEQIQSQQQFTRSQSERYKKICSQYESQKYDFALQGCEKLLNELPENGEALGMKHLILYQQKAIGLNKALEGIKHGLRNNLRSSTLWHLYGILCRNEQLYSDALKAFKTMNNLKGNSMFLKRDLYCLQIQNRDFKGALETRNTMTQQKKEIATNWITNAVAAYFAKNYTTCLATLNYYIQRISSKEHRWRYSDLLLFKSKVLIESKDFEKALQLLTTSNNKILDRMTMKDQIAFCQLKLGQTEEALISYSKLLKMNVNNKEYHSAIHSLLGFTNILELSNEQLGQLDQLYTSLDINNSNYVKLQSLCLLPDGAVFEEKIEDYIFELSKNNSSHLFKILQPVITPELSRNAKEKEAILDRIIEELSHAAINNLSHKSTQAKIIQQRKLSILCLRIGILLKKGHLEDAKGVIVSIGEKENQVEKCYWEAKCSFKQRNYADAAYKMNVAYQNDSSDRYLFNKSLKYYLRAGDVKSANALYSTLKGKNILENGKLNSQTILLLLEVAECHFNRSEFEQTKVAAQMILSAFDAFEKEIFDFHLYVFEKLSIPAYLDLFLSIKDYEKSPLKKRAIELINLIEDNNS